MASKVCAPSSNSVDVSTITNLKKTNSIDFACERARSFSTIAVCRDATLCDVIVKIKFALKQKKYISRSESYSVLSPFLSKLRYAYRRNRQNLFYLLVYFKFESEIAVKS